MKKRLFEFEKLQVWEEEVEPTLSYTDTNHRSTGVEIEKYKSCTNYQYNVTEYS